MFTIHGQSAANAIRAMAAGKWRHILAEHAPQLIPALENPRRHVPCPRHGGHDGFRVFNDVMQTGGGICNTCGPFPDGLSLLVWANGWSFKEAVRAVSSSLGLTMLADLPVRPERQPNGTPPSVGANSSPRARLRATWQATLPAEHPGASPLRRYLQTRVPQLELGTWPQVLRYHHALPYHDLHGRLTGHFSAMLAKVQDADGNAVSIHRTYLSLDGRKASVDTPKKLMPPVAAGATLGSAIRLFQAGSTLAVAEGIETALSVHHATGLPVWAAINANGLRHLILPPTITEVVICGDNDENDVGQAAANDLAHRLVTEARQVKVLIPPIVGFDWNDYVCTYEIAARDDRRDATHYN